jgi:hypothetical protein
VRAAWWHEQQDEVIDGFLVEPQNPGRAGTTWEPSPEWRLAEATLSSRGFRWFTRKPLGSLVDPQSQDHRTEDRAAAVPDRFDQCVPVRLDRSDRCATTQFRIFEAEDTCRDRKACIEAKQIAVAGHPSDGEDLKTSKTSLEGLVSLVSKGILDFRLPPYKS